MADRDDIRRDEIRREDVRREEVYREPAARDSGAGSAMWFIIGGVIVAALVLLFVFNDGFWGGGVDEAGVQIEETETEVLTAPIPQGEGLAEEGPAAIEEGPIVEEPAEGALEEPVEGAVEEPAGAL